MDGWTDADGCSRFSCQVLQSGLHIDQVIPGSPTIGGGLVAAASHYRSSITHVVRPVMNRAGCLAGNLLSSKKN